MLRGALARSFLGVVVLAGCGGAGEPPPAPLPASRVVLQGIAAPRPEDTLDGLELVSSGRGELVIRDERGVRARRRFGFVSSRVAGRFVGGARFVVVSSADDGGRNGFANPRDPFGMASGQLVRWDVTRDEVTVLAPAPQASPTLCRSGAHVIALHEGQLLVIGAASFTPSGTRGEELVERAGECFVRREGAWALARIVGDAISLEGVEAPEPAEPVGSDGVGPYLEAIEWTGLAPSSDVVAVGSREHAYVLSAEGVRAIDVPSQDCAFRSNGLLACGRVLVSTDVITQTGPSLVEAHVRSVVDADEWTIPALQDYARWRTTATEAAAAGTAIPPFPIPPVCAGEAPDACVRAHLIGTAVDAWELFDPATPDVVRARLPRARPPGPGYVRVSPGGRYVRDTTRGVAIHATDPDHDPTARSVVVVDPDDHHVLRALRSVGPAIERRFEGELDRVAIVDEGHVFVRVPRDGGDEGHVIDVATLESTRVIALGIDGDDRVLRCRGVSLARADGSAAEGACPISIGDDEAGRVTVSASGAFWLDARRLDQIVVHRARDGATLTLALLDDGLVAFTADGAFEIEGATAADSLGRVEVERWDTGALVAAGTEQADVVRAFFASP